MIAEERDCQELKARILTQSKQIFNTFIIFYLTIFIVSCDSKHEYDKGYKEGEKVGYSQGYDNGRRVGYDNGYEKGKYDGYNNGYTKGKDDGYTSGYANGTVAFIKKYGLPSLGLTIIILCFLAFIYYFYKYYKDPVKRKINNTTNLIETKRQKLILEKELKRQILSADKINKIKATIIANGIFIDISNNISDEEIITEIEKLRLKAEGKIFEYKMNTINEIYNIYIKTIQELDKYRNISDKEKIEIYRDIKQQFEDYNSIKN